MKQVVIPTPLRSYTEGLSRHDVQGETVGAALAEIVKRYPALQPQLFDESGKLHSFVSVFLHEEEVRSLQGEATPLNEGDRIIIALAVSGG
jgi:molybdopterin converting factor small subunit